MYKDDNMHSWIPRTGTICVFDSSGTTIRKNSMRVLPLSGKIYVSVSVVYREV
jgi:hypothetical protein